MAFLIPSYPSCHCRTAMPSALQVMFMTETISPLVLHSASVLFSTFFYGIVVTLTWSCIGLLLRTTKTRSIATTQFFITFVTLMFLLSTVSEVLLVRNFFSVVRNVTNTPEMIATNGPGIILISQYRPNPYPLMLVFTALVVDTLMVRWFLSLF